MVSDEKGINLLPHDIRSRRNKSKKTKKASSFLHDVDYTEPEGEVRGTKSEVRGEEKPARGWSASGGKEKLGFFSRLFGGSKKDTKAKDKSDKKSQKQNRDLPVGKPLSSALFATEDKKVQGSQPEDGQSSAERLEAQNEDKREGKKQKLTTDLSDSTDFAEKPARGSAQREVRSVPGEKEEQKAIKPIQIKPIKIYSPAPSSVLKNVDEKKIQGPSKKSKGFFSKIFSVFFKSKKDKDQNFKNSESTLSTQPPLNPPLNTGGESRSAMFEKTTRVPKKKINIEYSTPQLNGESKGIEADKVQSLHNPDFLNFKPVETLEDVVKDSKKKKKSFWSRIFLSKSKEEKVQGSQPESGQPLAEKFKAQSKGKEEKRTEKPAKGWSASGRKKKGPGIFKRMFTRKKKLDIDSSSSADKSADSADSADKKEAEKKKEETKDKKQSSSAKAMEDKEIAPVIEAKEINKPKDNKPSLVNTIEEKGLKGLTQAPVHKKDSHDVNLLSAEYSQRFAQGNPKMAIITSVVSVVLIIALAWAGLHLYEVKGKSKTEEIVSINNALRETISTYREIEKEDKDLALRISTITKLLDNHITWKSFLERLEDSTIPEVTYVSMGASTKGSISISAIAKDYTSMARQITVFETDAPWIEQVFVTSASLSEDKTGKASGVVFDMLIVINSEALQYAEE